IADADYIYDVSTLDDQRVLGIKATMSVAELTVLHRRLQQGTEAKPVAGNWSACCRPGTSATLVGRSSKIPIDGCHTPSRRSCRSVVACAASARPVFGSTSGAWNCPSTSVKARPLGWCGNGHRSSLLVLSFIIRATLEPMSGGSAPHNGWWSRAKSPSAPVHGTARRPAASFFL